MNKKCLILGVTAIALTYALIRVYRKSEYTKCIKRYMHKAFLDKPDLEKTGTDKIKDNAYVIQEYFSEKCNSALKQTLAALNDKIEAKDFNTDQLTFLFNNLNGLIEDYTVTAVADEKDQYYIVDGYSEVKDKVIHDSIDHIDEVSNLKLMCAKIIQLHYTSWFTHHSLSEAEKHELADTIQLYLRY